jgi:hypothetical protein
MPLPKKTDDKPKEEAKKPFSFLDAINKKSDN